MEKKHIFVKQTLLEELTSDLQDTANAVALAGEKFNAAFPGRKWSNEMIWALLFDERADGVRGHFFRELRNRVAKENGLTYNASTESLIYFLMRNQDPTDSLISKARHLRVYMRTGALNIDKHGRTQLAKDAVQRIKEFCSVTIENKQEWEFYEKAAALKTQMANVVELHKELVKCAVTKQGQSDIEKAITYDNPKLTSNIRMFSESSVWRALVTYVLIYRKNDTARFFNNVGGYDLSLAEIYAMTGYKPQPTPELRIACADLYADVPFLNNNTICNVSAIDTQERLEEKRDDILRWQSLGIAYEIDHKHGRVKQLNNSPGVFNPIAPEAFKGYDEFSSGQDDYIYV